MMRKVLALLLSVSAAVSLSACGGRTAEPAEQSSVEEIVPVVTTPPRTVRAGLILPGSDGDPDAASSPFLLCRADADMSLSAKNIQVSWDVRYAPDEDACEEAGRALAEGGCQAVFSAAPEYEEAVQAAAADNSGVQFSVLGGVSCWNDDLDNTHNAFAAAYEGWYLAGAAAALKVVERAAADAVPEEAEPVDLEAEEAPEDGETVEDAEPEEPEPVAPSLGFVAGLDTIDTVSAYTAFLIGARRIAPEATLTVRYTDAENDAAEDREAAKELAAEGCEVIAQNTGSVVPALVAQALGLYHIGYNADRTSDAPDASLLSVNIDWSYYYEYALDSVVLGVSFDQDWCRGLKQSAVSISTNRGQISGGIDTEVRQMQSDLRNGAFQVFDTSAFTIRGRELESAPVDFAFTVPEDEETEPEPLDAVFDGAFHESYYRSYPYFDYRIDGVEILN